MYIYNMLSVQDVIKNKTMRDKKCLICEEIFIPNVDNYSYCEGCVKEKQEAWLDSLSRKVYRLRGYNNKQNNEKTKQTKSL